MAEEDRPRPIHSSLAEDPAFQDAIDAFVVELASRVDDLQDCEAWGDFERLCELSEALRLDSEKVGYESLARCSAAVRDVAGEHRAEDARKVLVELTEISQRVRLGHRGAA